LLNASRRKRIAEGSGTSVQDVNKLVKQYQDMAKMMKRLGKGGGGDPAALASMFGGGAPGGDAGASGLPPGEMPDLSKLGGMPGLGGGMPGLGKGGFPGLGGMSRLGGKKKKR
jgi:signal recognition particle subunit SRP54